MIENTYRKICLRNDILNFIHSKTILNREINSKFTPGFSLQASGLANNISKIFIIGTGGTGGWFMPKLIKILNDAHAKFLVNKLEVILIDGDTVELKNLARQNFVSSDVGKNKAEVMCNRYAPHLHSNLSMYYVDKFVANKTIISKYPAEQQEKFVDINTLMPVQMKRTSGDYLVINFIDNAITRKVIHNRIAELSNNAYHFNNIIFDVANNSYNGQINFSNYTAQPGPQYGMTPSNFFLRYPENLTDQEGIKLENCADADVNAVSQLFNANDFAASIIANTINAMFQDKCIKYGEISFNTGNNISVVPSCRLTGFSSEYEFVEELIYDIWHRQRSAVAKYVGKNYFDSIKTHFSEYYGTDLFDEFCRDVGHHGYNQESIVATNHLLEEFKKSFNSFQPS